MARAHAAPSEESFQIRAAAFTFEGFRRWAQSDTFPETGRIDYLAGDVDVDMSPEEIATHSLVKSAIALGLGNLIAETKLGYLFIDRTRVSSPAAKLSVEPDLVVLSQASLLESRVRPLSWSPGKPNRLTEIEGPADLVVDVVSDSSVRKDTRRLPDLYARAGVPEPWIADARGETMRFGHPHSRREHLFPGRAGCRRLDPLAPARSLLPARPLHGPVPGLELHAGAARVTGCLWSLSASPARRRASRTRAQSR